MLKRNIIFSTAIVVASIMAILLLGISVSSPAKAADIAKGKTLPHVNIAIFHKLHGQEGFTYPDHITSHDILSTLSGKAQFISINHTAGLKDGDVITIGNDVLRDENGKFEDFGVDCQIAIHIDSRIASASGMCEILMVDQHGRAIEHKGIIKPRHLQPGKDWILVYNDIEDGIAVYIDEEISNN